MTYCLKYGGSWVVVTSHTPKSLRLAETNDPLRVTVFSNRRDAHKIITRFTRNSGEPQKHLFKIEPFDPLIESVMRS